MAKQRMINTRFWIDDYISNLDPIEKLLFIYLLTNTYTDICGVYEIPIKNIAMDTGIDKDTILRILGRFERDGKMVYRNGWLGIKNFVKNQKVNPNVMVGIKRGLELAPKEITDTLSNPLIPFDTIPHLNSNLNLNSNSKIEGDTPHKINKSFFEGKEKYTEILDLFSKNVSDKKDLENEFKKFVLYWTEKNKSGTKERWEQQNTFDVKRRLYTWLSNKKEWANKFSSSKNQPNYVL